MKITLQPAQFVFDPVTKTVNFDNMFGAFKPERLLAVINVTTGALIYATASAPSYGGTFSNGIYTKSVLTYSSSNAGQSVSDIIEVLYDDENFTQNVGGTVEVTTNNNPITTIAETHAADGTEILSSVDAMSGKDGLDVHLLSSSFGGQIGNPIPLPNNLNALSVGFLNGGALVTPKMDPVTNELIVQSAGVPLQDVNITQIGGSGVGSTLPVDIVAQSLGQIQSNIYLNGVGPDTNNGPTSGATLRTASNMAFAGAPAQTGSGTINSATQRVVLATDQPTIPTTTDVTKYGGTSTSLGQKAMFASMPVVLASDQSAINTALPDLNITGQATLTLSNNLLLSAAGLGALDCAGYKSASVQVVTTAATGAYIFEGSQDGSNWQNIPAFRLDSASPAPLLGAIAATSSSFTYIVPVRVRYMRLRISTVLGVTAQAFTRLSQDAFVPPVITTVQATAANLNATITGNIGTVTTVTGVTTVSSVTSAALAGTTTTDIASAAITTTTTSANISTAGIQSVSFQMAVTAVSGTTPTLDVVIQETFDGANYFDIYHFPRITATGQFQSPQMRVNGIGIRYVRTVGGTTPSFTMSGVRISRQISVETYRNFLSRTIDPNTLNSTTSIFVAEGADQFQLIANMAAGGTAPVFKMQGSEDGTYWFDMITVTGVVNTATQGSVNGNFMPKFIRGITSTAGVGSSLICLHLKARGA